jgi:hypothetical protein
MMSRKDKFRTASARAASPDAGYEGPEDDDTYSGPTWFELEKYEQQHAITGFYCRILRNGEPVGMIRLPSEREFDHLKSRINSTLEETD